MLRRYHSPSQHVIFDCISKEMQSVIVEEKDSLSKIHSFSTDPEF